jgi:hypothetical protein
MIDPKWLFRFGLFTVSILDIVLATILLAALLEA